jgi:hypothetical protein
VAEIRVDGDVPGSNAVLVYLVCPKCRLRRYVMRTTKKVILIQGKLDRARMKLETLEYGSYAWNQLLAIINTMEIQKRKAERI